ncbi:extracellular solute-binding protein [Blautia sp. MSJ-19]|uniref:extracellular solute-binding protein n=1 Tax=Blautia sp. MSJ-19 TaxID=2841517 RepID=UPI001C0EE37D|nr:extracellular solute-binding protein [Blautia sp. MSJ-19]MBU5479740.1 extracellular solute-binding protein [Blautia sp. MSJ-19]
MKCKRITIMILFCSFVLSGCGGFSVQTTTEKSENAEESGEGQDTEKWQQAASDTYSAYPELVTYTLGQMSGANNSNLPEGDTYEDNAYTRYLRKMLNIQNDNVYMESEDRYDEFVNILVKDQTLPDVLVVSDRETLKELVDNDLIEDLTEVYENCTTSKIKEMFESYGSDLLNAGRFDGKLMAIPETVTDHGPNLMWLRKDWMDELGLDEPETLDDAFDIIDTFVENRMGTPEGEEPVGLVCDTELVGSTSSSYSVDPVFDKFQASPQRWVKKNGEIIYGSVTQETKNALSYLHELYERGVLDQNFALRASNNLRDLVVNGRCGAFFGLWWTPNNPLMDVYEKDKTADWEPYYLQESEKGQAYASFRDNKYVVVRKGYEHPEIVMKIISVLFDYTRYEADDADEVNEYFALNVDPTARPLVINVDYNEATFQITRDIRAVEEGTKKEETLSAIEKSYYDACEKFLHENSDVAEDWAAYKSRVSAVGLLVDGHYQSPEMNYLDDTDGEIPKSLQKLEKDSFIQIIMGVKPVSYFDTFVKEWYEQGGEELTEQIRRSNPGE